MVFNKVWRELLPMAIVLILAYVSWNHVPTLHITLDGYTYFVEESYEFNLKEPLSRDNYLPLRSELFARISFHIMSRLYGDNIRYYMTTLFVAMLVIFAVMYLSSRIVTKSRLAGLFAGLFFSMSFISNFNMFSGGGYQYVVQRGILLPTGMLAFALLVVSVNRRILGYYLASIILYLFTVFMGFFTTFLLPLFVFYPIFFVITDFSKNKLFYLLAPFPFIVGNYLMVRHDGAVPSNQNGEGFIIFASHIFKSTMSILQQLSVSTFPIFWDKSLLESIKANWGIIIAADLRLLMAEILTIVVYYFMFRVVWRKNKQWRALAVTAVTTSAVGFIFNNYISVEPMKTFTTLRYFYYPFAPIAIFWGIFFATIMNTKKKWIGIVTVITITIWAWYNYHLIKQQVKEEAWLHKANRDTIAMIKSYSDTFSRKPSLVYTPGPLGPYGTYYAWRFYSGSLGTEINFLAPDLGELAAKNINPEMVYVFQYDYVNQQVVDKTTVVREELKKLEEIKEIRW